MIFHMRGKKISNGTPQVLYSENDINKNDNAQITTLERYHNNQIDEYSTGHISC